jgi:hypothetical protein
MDSPQRGISIHLMSSTGKAEERAQDFRCAKLTLQRPAAWGPKFLMGPAQPLVHTRRGEGWPDVRRPTSLRRIGWLRRRCVAAIRACLDDSSAQAQSFQKPLNRSGAKAVYRTVDAIDRCPR